MLVAAGAAPGSAGEALRAGANLESSAAGGGGRELGGGGETESLRESDCATRLAISGSCCDGGACDCAPASAKRLLTLGASAGVALLSAACRTLHSQRAIDEPLSSGGIRPDMTYEGLCSCSLAPPNGDGGEAASGDNAQPRATASGLPPRAAHTETEPARTASSSSELYAPGAIDPTASRTRATKLGGQTRLE